MKQKMIKREIGKDFICVLRAIIKIRMGKRQLSEKQSRTGKHCPRDQG